MKKEKTNNVEARFIVSKRKSNRKAFTLVELIIVITILAILRTIGFMSFQSYTIDARDTNRITSLKEIGKGLELYQLKNSTFPNPDAQSVTTLDSSGNTVTIQGYAGASVQKTIRMTSETKDPKDNTYYTYSVNGTKTKYQLLNLLEKDPTLVALSPDFLKSGLVEKTYARIDYTTRYRYTSGNKVGIFFSGTTNQPLQETNSGTLALSGITTQLRVMFSNSLTNSGTINATGSSLPAIVVTESNSVASTSTNTTTYSCTGTLVTANATITNSTNLTVNTAYQNTNSTNPCYYTCNTNYSGIDCSTYTRPIPSCTSAGQIKYVISGVVGTSDVGLTCNDDIIVCSGNSTGYKIAACNLGATTVYTTQTFSSATTARNSTVNTWAGGLYQWGNNGEISYSTNSDTQVNTISPITYGPGNYYNSSIFISNAFWAIPQNDNLWGSGGTVLDRRGPCPVNYHLPTSSEWQNIISAGGWPLGSTHNMGTQLKLPLAGYRIAVNLLMDSQGAIGYYISTTPINSSYQAMAFGPSIIVPSTENGRSYGNSIRCFRN